MLKRIAVVSLTFALVLSTLNCFALARGAGQAQMQNNQQQMQQNKRQMERMKQHQQMRAQHQMQQHRTTQAIQ